MPTTPKRTSSEKKGSATTSPPTTPRTRPRGGDVPPPKTPPDEKSTMLGILDYLRDRVVAKVDGVAEPAVRRPGVVSGTNLLGLVKHLGYAEHNQFLGKGTSDWPATFQATTSQTVASVLADYREAVAESNRAIADCELSDPVGGSGPPLRWRLAHMIEETGRHLGQMDILREGIDGATGR